MTFPLDRLASTRAEDKAATSRAAVHQRTDQLVDRVGHVEASVATIGEDVAEISLPASS